MAGAEDNDHGRMSDMEALMWRMEQFDARQRSVITIVGMLDRLPHWPAVVHRVEMLTRVLPRFRQRVAPDPTPLVAPRWVQDEEFDLAYHLRRVRVAGDGCMDEVLAMAAAMSADGLDPSRPLWQATLIDGVSGGRAAFVVRLHHTFTDGLGALKLAMVLFDFDPDAAPVDLPPLEEEAPAPALRRMAGDLAHEAQRALGIAQWAVPAVTGLVRDAWRAPEERVERTLDLVRGLAASGSVTSSPGSPIMTGRSTRVVFGVVEMALDDALAAARAGGGTVNDLFLAVVVDGLRRYHARHASFARSIRIGMPVSLRGEDDASLENQFFPTRIVAPLQEADPLVRLRAMHDLVAAERHSPVLAAYAAMAGLMRRVRGVEVLIGRVMGSIDVTASNVPGSPDPLYLVGARVLRLIPFGPRAGAGLNLTMLSYDGTLAIGANLDPAATPDTGVLLDCLRTAATDALAAL